MTALLSLGDRMKQYYEEAYKIVLPMRMPVILRLDGRAFHTFTSKMRKPFDPWFIEAMETVTINLVKEIQGTQIAYTYSDEISILVHNYKRFRSQSWFGNELQKMVSVSAGIASAIMTAKYQVYIWEVPVFDSRAFVLPEAEVCNYFVWRQRDCIRNSILAYGQSVFGHAKLQGVDCEGIRLMLAQEGKDWERLRQVERQGMVVLAGERKGKSAPLFAGDRGYIERLLEVEEE